MVFLAMVISRAAFPQQGDLFLIGDTLDLEEVTVKTLRYAMKEKMVALPLTVVTDRELELQSGLTVSELLAREPGVALYRDGAWGTSVVVRGLGENRIISMINGNRIETATDLAGGLSMVDVNDLERMELIRGSASALYGSGGMGGVLNLITKKGSYRESPGFEGRALAYYEQVNRLAGTHLSLETGGSKWNIRAAGGYRQAQNIRTPEGELDNSQFTDYNYHLSAGVKPFKNHELTVDFQDFVASDVGIPGGAALAPAATATYLEASRRLLQTAYTIDRPGATLSQFRLNYFNQNIFRDVEILPNMPPSLAGNKRMTANRINPAGAHATNGASATLQLDLQPHHQVIAGLDYWQRQVRTTREKYITQEILDDFYNVIQTLELVRGEKPIPDSRFSSGGFFIQDRISVWNGRLDIQTGLRLDAIGVYNEEARDPHFLRINGAEKDPVPGQRVVFEEQRTLGSAWSLHTGLLYHMDQNHHLSWNVGRSFRSASLEERFKYIDLGARVRLGDPDLNPEKGWFTDLGYRYWGKRFQVQCHLYANYLDDMIVEKPGVFVYNQTDTLPALINTNVDRALLLGYDLDATLALSSQVRLRLSSAWTRGLDLSQAGNLPLIAPWHAALGAQYRLAGVLTACWTTRLVAPQKQIAEGETATDGYLLTDLSLVSEPARFGDVGFRLFFGVNNLFNTSYENHLATNRGLVQVEPGRNVFLRLEMTF